MENFYWGFLNLKKKKNKKDKKKENILTGYVYQLGQRQGAGLRGWGATGPHRETQPHKRATHAHTLQGHTAALTDPETWPRHI